MTTLITACSLDDNQTSEPFVGEVVNLHSTHLKTENPHVGQKENAFGSFSSSGV